MVKRESKIISKVKDKGKILEKEEGNRRIANWFREKFGESTDEIGGKLTDDIKWEYITDQTIYAK